MCIMYHDLYCKTRSNTNTSTCILYYGSTPQNKKDTKHIINIRQPAPLPPWSLLTLSNETHQVNRPPAVLPTQCQSSSLRLPQPSAGPSNKQSKGQSLLDTVAPKHRAPSLELPVPVLRNKQSKEVVWPRHGRTSSHRAPSLPRTQCRPQQTISRVVARHGRTKSIELQAFLGTQCRSSNKQSKAE
jgi:hypothetical protein